MRMQHVHACSGNPTDRKTHRCAAKDNADLFVAMKGLDLDEFPLPVWPTGDERNHRLALPEDLASDTGSIRNTSSDPSQTHQSQSSGGLQRKRVHVLAARGRDRVCGARQATCMFQRRTVTGSVAESRLLMSSPLEPGLGFGCLWSSSGFVPVR